MIASSENLMATHKTPAGPERVHSKSFNGAKRGTVVRRFTAPTPDSFFGAEFALVEFDHHPEPIWSSAQWLKKPFKRDLYERWRAAPQATTSSMLEAPTEDLLRACARISCGQVTHHNGRVRWTGLVRHLPLDDGTETLLPMLERMKSDARVRSFDEAAILDGSEYNKSDYKYGPRVKGAEVYSMMLQGLQTYWRYALGGQRASVAETLRAPLRERARALLKGTNEDGQKHLDAHLTAPTAYEAFQGVNRDFNTRCGLDGEYAMVIGTGF